MFTLAYGPLVDADQDGIPDLVDNCPIVQNFFQDDSDSDGVGDVCDNCPYTYNPDQIDTTGMGIGDACACSLVPQPPVGPSGCSCAVDGGVIGQDEGAEAGDICGAIARCDGGVTE